MRARILTTPTLPIPVWREEDDATFTRTQAALHDALEQLDLPEGTLEDTAKIMRLPYDY